MSNYINNLIARNRPVMGDAKVVRPRLPSIFEPSPAGAQTAFNDPDLTAPGETPPARDAVINSDYLQANRVERTNRASQPSLSDERSGEAQNANAAPPAWRGIQQLPAGRESTDELAISPQTARLNAPQVTTPAIHSNRNERAEEMRQRNTQANREGQLSPRPGVPQKDEAEAADNRARLSAQANAEQPLPAPQANRQIPRPAHHHLAQPMIEEASRAASPVESIGSRIVVQPRVSLRDETHKMGEGYRSSHQQPLFQPHEAPPTINVTIGRIEVKALPPPAAQPRQKKSAAPLMSLDEYMRKRNAGGDSV